MAKFRICSRRLLGRSPNLYYMAQELTKETFDEAVLKSGKPALIDFYAPWCGPCKMMGPIIDELAEEYKDKNIVIAKVNVDENNVLSAKYNVMSIPTLIFFNESTDITETLNGMQNKNTLKEKLDALIN